MTAPVTNAAVENVSGPLAHHGEAPVWWAAERSLLWVDGDAGDLLSLRDGEVRRQRVDDEYLAFVRPRVQGGLVAVGARTLRLSDAAGADFCEVATLLDDPLVRMNDGCCDPQGRLLTGSMAYDAASGAGVVVRVDADLTRRTVITDVTVSNGICFSPTGSLAYYVDSLAHRIDVFDVHEGDLVNRRPFAEIVPGDGIPDGLTVAADGSVWVAIWGGSEVRGYAPDGRPVTRIALPVAQVSACAFGDDDLGTLYITTSAQGLPADHGTAAGSLYAVRLSVTGIPVAAFAG